MLLLLIPSSHIVSVLSRSKVLTSVISKIPTQVVNENVE